MILVNSRQLSVVSCQLTVPCQLANWKLFAVVCLMLAVGSCKSDQPNPRPENPSISLANSSNVIIANEGNFQFGNASVSFLNGQTGQVSSDVFRPANGRDLGDVAQSAIVWNNRLYVVVNNSKKIEVLDLNNFRSTGTISGLVSPRYMLPVSNSKAYVSDLYANAISVVDLNSLSITKTIPCKGWTEKMILHLGKVYVTNYWQSYLYVIDPVTDTKTDSIFVGKGAKSIVADKKDRIIVACGGYKTAQSDTRLVFINLNGNKIEKTIAISVNYPSSLSINASKDTLYFLNKNVYKLSVEDTQVGAPFILKGTRELYNLSVDVRTNQVFVSDAVDFVQIGKVYVYSPLGAELAKFEAGITPGDFCFY